MATRTAPVVAIANITSSHTTARLIDASGDKTATTLITPTLVSDLLVETWAAEYQLATQASIYEISQTILYTGDDDSSNADTDQRNSIADGVNHVLKSVPLLKTQTLRAVAPTLTMMLGNQDIPILGNPGYENFILATLAFMAQYNHKSSQFTGVKERKNNPRVVS